ncbi:MAG: haloacid dehalogenase superfamily enzyme subfamily [Desulfobulbaceae bacterium]|jgi:HAD superfamily hydrolase (TIGR01549 family)|nr:MAG: haloacid dehalogenase superfamily enzyme subfamily [Desulfobulbaceae bacterium]
MLKLIIFDCDGVMFDSKFANRQYYNQLLAHFNRPAMTADEIEHVHIHNVTDSTRHIFRAYPDQDMTAVDAYRKTLDYAPFLNHMRMEPDLIEFLETTKPRYQLAISTNRTNTMIPILEIFQLQDYFTKVMTAENARRPKPAPDALLEILDHCQCQADEAIYIGDSIIDQEHAASCGMRLIGFRNPALSAEYHVNSFMEILKLPPFLDQP